MRTDDRDKILFFLRKGYFREPQFLQIEITDSCPLTCPQCYKKEGSSVFMPIDRFENIIDEAYEMGIKEIFLNGGEPLEHPFFEEMVAYSCKKKISSTIFTSGYKIEKKEKVWKKYDTNILISLNGSCEEINKKSRGGYYISLNAMKYLKKINTKYGINWVARHDNVYDLPKLVEISKKYNASYINIVCNKISGKGNIDSPLNREDYIFLKKEINKESDYFRVQNCYGILLSLLGEKNNRLYGCQAGIRVMAIDTRGSYMPCTHMFYDEKTTSIKDYWNNSDVLRKLRSISKLTYCNDCNRCRVCHSISKEAHDDLTKGFKDCPVKEIYNEI